MNCLILFKRYLRLSIIPESAELRFPHLHWLALFGSLIVLAAVLALTSHDAEATRDEKMFSAETPFPASPTEKIVVPLQLPPPATHALDGVNFQDAALSEQDWHTLIVKRGDNLSSIFLRLGLDSQQLQDVLELGPETATLARLMPGETIRVRIGANKELQGLVYDVDENSLRIHREQDKLRAVGVKHDLETRLSYATGVIESSLFESGQQAGLSDNMILAMAEIFGWDVDFAQDLREGDSFTVLYEEQYLAGEKVRDGAIVAAEFTNRGKTYRAVRFTESDGVASYYTPEGLSMRKAFLRTPVKFTRISSGFTLARFHPILHRMRAHKGVDYAGPVGTPIKAASDGKVIFKGVKGGYGNTVILQHFGKYSTLYAHMAGFARGLKQGSSVRQGEIIGYLGKSGLATGPHLHYEFRVNGVHQNPLTVPLPKAEPIQAKYKNTFTKQARSLVAQMDMFKTSRLALNQNTAGN
ncbi:MAG: peptidoglycan DD-metalloendopeptidase family protein [Pseudomonadota bacterium]